MFARVAPDYGLSTAANHLQVVAPRQITAASYLVDPAVLKHVIEGFELCLLEYVLTSTSMPCTEYTTHHCESAKAHHESGNPFIAFRRFADEQVSSFVNLLFGSTPFPTNSLSSAKGLEQDPDAWFTDVRGSQEQHKREAEEAAQIISLCTRAQKDASNTDNKVIHEQAEEDISSMACPYRNVQQHPSDSKESHDPFICLREKTRSAFSHQCHASSPLHPDLLLLQILGPPGPRSGVPLSSMGHGEYSILRFEQQQPFSDHGSIWRAAVEDHPSIQNGQGCSGSSWEGSDNAMTYPQWASDIISLVIDKGMRQREEAGEGFGGDMTRNAANFPDAEEGDCTEKNYKRNVMDGLTNLLLGLGLGDASANANHKAATAVDEYTEGEAIDQKEDLEERSDQEATEFDLYEYFLRKQDPSMTESSVTESHTAAQPQHHISPSTASKMNNPTVLSTLTTTEKTTLPDGTTHTKVVLKKRFSNGREESTETIHTQSALPEMPQQPATDTTKEPDTERNRREGKGWFWSQRRR
ncbi:MAG: hypothetical protein Q9163_003727 [Psora crenata]